MIVGLLCRHYKIYKGLNFIPICNDYENPFSLLIGNNAVGKSSVLECLNTFMNNGNWNRTKNTKASEAFIAPLFLIKKQDIEGEIDAESFFILQKLSEYFWNVTVEANANLNTKDFKRFFEFRDELKYMYGEEDYLLILLGISQSDKSQIYYSTFTGNLESTLGASDFNFRDIKLISKIKSYYSYIYIPVESVTSDVVKIENSKMQDLMSTDILNEIDSILNERTFTKKNGTTRKVSLIEYLNSNLDSYMNEINNTISSIDSSYAYRVEYGFKKNLRPRDVRSRILEAYFSIRTLKKNKKEIFELSSGEQRVALIDIATAFLQEQSGNKGIKILAIDEPENSLHISKAFIQFSRILNLVGDNQIIITTHWYGALPVTDIGNIQFIETEDGKVNINTYYLNNYFEKRGSLPEDIQIKSYFDLTASILYSMRSDGYNWIICEGSDDKLYLEYYLNDLPNLKILSVGGCGNVIKIYKYLFSPFLEKDEKKNINSKVLCLIDTDEIIHDLRISSDIQGKLKLGRIQVDEKDNMEIKSVTKSGYHKPSEIEDCLEPYKYYSAVKEVIMETSNSLLKETFNKFEYKENAKSSIIKREAQTILKDKELVQYEDKKLIYDFLDNNHNKYNIAKNYTSKPKENMPELFKQIKQFFE